jgi:hypothetical protein
MDADPVTDAGVMAVCNARRAAVVVLMRQRTRLAMGVVDRLAAAQHRGWTEARGPLPRSEERRCQLFSIRSRP